VRNEIGDLGCSSSLSGVFADNPDSVSLVIRASESPVPGVTLPAERGLVLAVILS
jgi:hypothetical protein